MYRRRTRRALLATLLAAAALPAAAQANTVSLSGGTLLYQQTTSQGSNVNADAAAGTVRVRSSTGVTTALAPCTRTGVNEASCPSAQVQRIRVILGEGADLYTTGVSLPTVLEGRGSSDTYRGTLNTGRNEVSFFGGAGLDIADYQFSADDVTVTKDNVANDGRSFFDGDDIRDDVERIVGSPRSDRLTGNGAGGVEEFDGGPGDDTITGNGGPDIFLSRPTADGADTLSGGAGFDSVSYFPRTQPITATLGFRGRDDGEAGERDQLSADINQVLGSHAGDTIRAAAGQTLGYTFVGGPGGDFLEGSEGPDTLNGGGGVDTIAALGFADLVLARDGESDIVGCGTGTDTAELDASDIDSSCETSRVGVLRLAPAAVDARAGEPVRLRLSWRHPRAWKQLRTIELRLTQDGVPVGEITVDPRRERITAGGEVALLRRATRLARDGKTVSARLALRLDAALAGQTLKAEVEATDRRGRRQLERNAGSVRVSG